MLRAFISLTTLVALLALTGCYHAPIKPPIGYLYTEISAPMGVYGDGAVGGQRVGSAESVCYVGLVAQGDCSVAAACRQGGITRIQQIDYEFYNLAGIAQRYTTVVRGE